MRAARERRQSGAAKLSSEGENFGRSVAACKQLGASACLTQVGVAFGTRQSGAQSVARARQPGPRVASRATRRSVSGDTVCCNMDAFQGPLLSHAMQSMATPSHSDLELVQHEGGRVLA